MLKCAKNYASNRSVDSHCKSFQVKQLPVLLNKNYVFFTIAPPQVVQQPPEKFYAVNEGTGRISFQITGSPTPKYVWYRDTVPVNADADYIEYKDGGNYLIVKDVIDSDAGMYQLRASNAAGEVQISSEFVVRPVGECQYLCRGVCRTLQLEQLKLLTIFVKTPS